MSADNPVAVALAMPGDVREAEILDIVGSARSCVMARRCLDIPDLLAMAQAGRIDVALIGGEILRWDQDVVARLHALGIAVVALAGEREGSRELQAFDVDRVLAWPAEGDVRAHAAELIDALSAAPRTVQERESSRRASSRGFAHARTSMRSHESGPSAAMIDGPVAHDDGSALALMVAVWGPTGAPGRSTVAWAMAQAWAQDGATVLLIDADPYGGTLDQMLGLMDDEVPAIAAACRLAHHGKLDAASLVGLARGVAPGLSVLTGLARAERWPELRPASLAQVWAVARTVAEVVVIDTGFCLEEDEELSYDTLAPRRNAATVSAIRTADTVVAIGSVDPIGVRRLVRGLDDLDALIDEHELCVVGNRGTGKGRQTAVRREVESILRTAGHDVSVTVLPDDPAVCRRAVREGLSPLEIAPKSPLVKAVIAFTRSIHRVNAVSDDDRTSPMTDQSTGSDRSELPLSRLRRLVG